MSRPSSTSPFSRTTPLATVRREQVQSGDPLLDVAMPTNQYDNVPPPPTSSAAIVSNPPVVKPGENFVPQASNPFRQVSAQDTIELLSEQLFQICR